MELITPYAKEDASLEYLSSAGAAFYRPNYLFYRNTKPLAEYDFPPHIHQNYELIVPGASRYRCLLDGKPVTAGKGMALIIQPSQVHEDFYDSKEPFQSIRFVISSGQEQTLARLFAAGVPPARQAVKIHKYGVALEILALLRREALCDELGDYDVQNGLFQSFFRLCIASCPDELFNPEFLLRSPQKHIHGKILAAFEEQVFSNPTLAELCKRCEMTPSFLSRRCWELFAQPPLKAFLNYKIQQVKRKMIENPNLKLKELSDIFGFENQFHFSRVFKSYAGLPPSAFCKRPDAGRRQGLRRNAER